MIALPLLLLARHIASKIDTVAPSAPKKTLDLLTPLGIRLLAVDR